MKRILTLTITTLAIVLSVPAGLAFAQTASKSAAPAAPGGGQALEIGPPVVNLSGDPGQTVSAKINLRDVSPTKLVVSNEINDFVAAGEDGTPKILLDGKEPNPYSIKSWISPLPKFTLVPKQIQTLTITVKIPKSAAPGGYYGVIRFTGTPPGLEGTGVSLSASLGSLVLMKVNGDAKEQLSIAEFFTASGSHKNSLFESAPLNFVERIKNSGNIHEQPTGMVTVTDMFGKTLATVPVNQPPRNVLPGSIRKFEQPLDSSVIGNKFLFGKYTAKLDMTYGSGVQPLTATVEFWVIPYKLIAAIIIGLIALFFLVRYALRRYAQRVLNQSRGGRRR